VQLLPWNVLHGHLVSIEDSYGCKRSLSVQGISVNVRRVQVRALVSVLLVIPDKRETSQLRDFMERIITDRLQY